MRKPKIDETRQCKMCGSTFVPTRRKSVVCASPRCKQLRMRERSRDYKQTEAGKAVRQRYAQSEAYKEWSRRYEAGRSGNRDRGEWAQRYEATRARNRNRDRKQEYASMTEEAKHAKRLRRRLRRKIVGPYQSDVKYQKSGKAKAAKRKRYARYAIQNLTSVINTALENMNAPNCGG